MEPDFTGYASKANIKCTDGRTILPDAFAHQDSQRVPLVWHHAIDTPENILGHAILEKRADGTYCRAFFNDSPKGVATKLLVQHGDVDSLSIFANQLVEKSKVVMHGMIREVSVVIAGANSGAKIDFVNIQHDDGEIQTLDDEAIIKMGLPLEGFQLITDGDEDEPGEEIQHADKEGLTVKQVFETMNEQQQEVVYFLMGEALAKSAGTTAEHSATVEDAPTEEQINAVFHSFSEEQENVARYMIEQSLQHGADSDDNADEAENGSDGNQTVDEAENGSDDEGVAHADTVETTTSADAENQEGNSMTHNAFETHGRAGSATGTDNPTASVSLSHDDRMKIFKNAQRMGSLKMAFEHFMDDGSALKHGIDNIEVLFPDAKTIESTPQFLKRRTEWVADVLGSTRHIPFSRVRSVVADITMASARAKGYIKGNLKKEEFFKVSRRTTEPKTIYKKQQLDRDDILDITDFDVVAWLKAEMRLMLEEELARAILLGDGRAADDPDKIDEDHLRPIATDHELYTTSLNVNINDAQSSVEEVIDSLILNRRYYRGSGTPALYTGEVMLSRMLMLKDGLNRRIYSSVEDLKTALRVSKIVPIEVFDDEDNDVVAIMVNLQDYSIGTDRGGDLTMFDDFDIDYNLWKYLMETRVSGALTKLKSALVLRKVAGTSTLVDPVAPTWDAEFHTVTVATTEGVTYRNADTNTVMTTGAPVTLAEGQELTVRAVPNSGYYMSSNAGDQWTFDYETGRTGTAF